MKKLIVGLIFILHIQLLLCSIPNNKFSELYRLKKINLKKSEQEEQKRKSRLDELLSFMHQFDKSSQKNYWIQFLLKQEEKKENMRLLRINEFLLDKNVNPVTVSGQACKDECHVISIEELFDSQDPSHSNCIAGGYVASVNEVGDLNAAFCVVKDNR